MINISVLEQGTKNMRFYELKISYKDVNFDPEFIDKFELEELLHDLGSAAADIRDLLEKNYL